MSDDQPPQPNTVTLRGNWMRLTPLDADGRPAGEGVEFGQPPVVPGTVVSTVDERKALPAHNNEGRG